MMKYEGKHTKNNYLRKIRNMNLSELKEEYDELNRKSIIKGNAISRGLNPHVRKGGIPSKIIKWKYSQVVKQLYNVGG